MTTSNTGDPVARTQLEIDRPIYSENKFQEEYNHLEKDDSNLDKLKKIADKIELTPSSLWCFIQRLVPIVKWLPNYKIKSDLVGDTISGITTGIMRVPQEMAYAILATLPAVNGLYVAFFPVLTYAILGTSRHISVGTWPAVSIMAGYAIDDIVSAEISTRNGQLDFNEETELRIQVAISLSLLVGIIQISMGILRLGIITRYLSEPLIKGFTAGVAVHVFTNQFPRLFGVRVARYTGPFALIYANMEFFSELSTANTCAIIVSIILLLILVVIGEINDRQAAKGWCRKEGQKGQKLPIPSELLVVVLGTLSSYFGEFEEKYDLRVVGDIPTGLPFPVLPPTKYFGSLIAAAIAIATVGFAMSISMAQLFARKYNYEVDANQELIACGSSNFVGSFFQCFPSATSMIRTTVQECSGGKTQLASIFASIVVLVILLWLGPLLTQLPECVLAAIIVIALRGMFRQVSDLPMLWKVSIFDFSIWMFAFTFVVLLGVDLGLLIAVIIALITIVIRNQNPYCALMGRVPNTDIYRDVAYVPGVEEFPGIKIFRFSSSLSFINAAHFKSSLYKKAGFNPQNPLMPNEKSDHDASTSLSTPDHDVSTSISSPDHDASTCLHTVIIDCSMSSYIDLVGLKTLQVITADYNKVNVQVIFANCRGTLL
ncbi:prestin-like [Amphiura filiformis]|uniref:prestin-like n=1 Tax=Amphiura filiformis TaxID=82378 RepID=UPI003B20FB89